MVTQDGAPDSSSRKQLTNPMQLASLRTTVAVNTCLLYSELASALGPGLDPYCDLLLTNLLKMAGFTKKITAQQSQVCVVDILKHTTAPSRVENRYHRMLS